MVFAQLTGGEGIGRYLTLIDGATLDTATNRILLETAWGAVVGYTHQWWDELRSTAAFGYVKTVHDEYVEFQLAAGNNPNDTLMQAHLNLFWNPIPNFDIGAEYVWGKRRTYLDNEGDLSRTDLRFRFRF